MITALALPPGKTLKIEAASINLPIAQDINRMPFTGVLTKVDEVSDAAPNGTGGRRIRLTRAAAKRALPTIVSMGVNMVGTFDRHCVTRKVGLITGASIDGNDLNVRGIIFSHDNPQDALAIQQNKENLGFSFEASNIVVDGSLNANPLVIGDLTFTGASLLFRKMAAYHGTSLAASAAKEVVPVHPVLLRRLARCGFEQTEGDGNTLSQSQLDAVLADQSISDRITYRRLIAEAGIFPKGG